MWKREAISWSLAAVVLSFSLTLQAAETTLRISSWASPNHGINAKVWPTWGKWVEEATDGRSMSKWNTTWARHRRRLIWC